MSEQITDPSQTSGPMQSYFEWQVMTLMLAYDLVDPIARGNDQLTAQRREQVEREVSQLSMELIPAQYKQDSAPDLPPEVMMSITRTTFRRAAEITGK